MKKWIYKGHKLEIITAPLFEIPDEDQKKIIYFAKEAGMKIRSLYIKEEVDEILEVMQRDLAYLRAKVNTYRTKYGKLLRDEVESIGETIK